MWMRHATTSLRNPFHQAVEQTAFSTLEMALVQKYPTSKKDGLKKLLSRAISLGDISDRDFSRIQSDSDDPMKYTDTPRPAGRFKRVKSHGIHVVLEAPATIVAHGSIAVTVA